MYDDHIFRTLIPIRETVFTTLDFVFVAVNDETLVKKTCYITQKMSTLSPDALQLQNIGTYEHDHA